ncbi:MAG TPA: tRNA uridine-5-carboxymethylaminomethyl(34) synthesis GTPase MnmE, partial [Stenotrophomonas sp.]
MSDVSTGQTIVAIASGAAAGGVGMLRVSGPQSLRIAVALGCPQLKPR